MNFTLKNNQSNKKMLYVILRLIKDLDDKHLCTYQTISDLFELTNRQDSNNFYRLFEESGCDFGDFLIRKRKLNGALQLIESQVMKNEFLTVSENYHLFCQEHPEYSMSEPTFRKFFSEIDTLKYYNKIKSNRKKEKKKSLDEPLPDTDFSDISIKKVEPDIAKSDRNKDDKRKAYNFHREMPSYQKAILSLLFLSSGLSMDIIGMMFGVSKNSIHKWIRKLPNINKMLLNSIKYWSGVICVDEKYIKINGVKHYILSIVDDETGFPLYIKTVNSLKAETWAVFIREFKDIYGKPRLIISDGSLSLAAARKKVFPFVPFQFCWFHKIKNLNERIYEVNDEKTKKKLLELSHNLFHNTYISSRKRTAWKIVAMKIPGVSEYVKKNILGNWKHLTKMKTSNSVERFNRKLDKLFSGHYGLKSVDFVNTLIDGLLLKETIRDHRHLYKGFFTDIDLIDICRNCIKPVQIISFISHKLFKWVA